MPVIGLVCFDLRGDDTGKDTFLSRLLSICCSWLQLRLLQLRPMHRTGLHFELIAIMKSNSQVLVLCDRVRSLSYDLTGAVNLEFVFMAFHVVV